MANAITTPNLQILLLLAVILLIWLFFRFVAPRILDCLTPNSEKRERAALVASVKALQALTVEEARARIEKEVFFAGNPAVTWTERTSDGPAGAFKSPTFALLPSESPPFALPPTLEAVFSRFTKIHFTDAAAEFSSERLNKWDEDFVEIGEGEDAGTFLVKRSTGEVYTAWPGSVSSAEGRRVREKARFAPSVYHAILLLGGAAGRRGDGIGRPAPLPAP
jgi:hypothetical protein